MRYLPWPAVSGGFAMCCRMKNMSPCPWSGKRRPLPPATAGRSSRVDDTGTKPRTSAAGDLSDFGGRQRRLAGSVAMAVLAVLYGIVSGHGMWYPINLLSAGLFPARSTVAQIAVFHWDALIIAAIIHIVCSVLVGLLYGAALPMFPRRPILLGGRDRPRPLDGADP